MRVSITVNGDCQAIRIPLLKSQIYSLQWPIKEGVTDK